MLYLPLRNVAECLLGGIVKIRSAVIAFLTVMALMFSGASVASAEGQPDANDSIMNDLSDEDIQYLHDFFSGNGVVSEVREQLISDLQDGEMWDSLKSGSIPVSSSTEAVGGERVITDTFADGSIRVSNTTIEIEGSSSGISPMSVTSCTNSGGSAYHIIYTGCRADVNLGLIRMGFYLDYKKYNGGGAEITNYYGRFHHFLGGALSNHRLERFSASKVRYSVDLAVAFKGFPLGWTAWMQANAGSSGVYTTNN